MSRRILLASLLLLTSAHAQQAPRQLYVLEQENIDMALTAQYAEGVHLAIAAMRTARLGPDFNWRGSQHGNTYFYISQVQSPSDQARSARLATAIDKATYDRFASLTDGAIRSRQLSVLEPVPEFSYVPADPIVQPRLNYVDIVQVHAARVDQFTEATTRTIAALKAAGYPIGFTTYRVVAGSPNPNDGPSYYLISPYNTRSQFYEEHPLVAAIEEALGKAEAMQLLAGQQKNLLSGQSFDHIRRSDLSYRSQTD
ncbi:MAG: hypothetical protein VB948_15805 [Pseudomonadales bacterium]